MTCLSPVTSAAFVAVSDAPHARDVIAELHRDPDADLMDTGVFRLIASWEAGAVLALDDIISVYDYGISLDRNGSRMVTEWSRVALDVGQQMMEVRH